MIRIKWDDAPLIVQRVVVRTDLSPRYQARLRRTAVRHGLFIVSPAATPQPGDFWLGCTPDGGWGDADPRTVGWAGVFDLDSALDALEVTAGERELVVVG
jgi:hypothetical protein